MVDVVPVQPQMEQPSFAVCPQPRAGPSASAPVWVPGGAGSVSMASGSQSQLGCETRAAS